MIDTKMSCRKSNVRPSIEVLSRFYRDIDRPMSLSIKNAIVDRSKLISNLIIMIGSLCTEIKHNGQRSKQQSIKTIALLRYGVQDGP
jgi:hypothetical protein